MQEKITPKCTFLHRTDILAAAKGINVQDLTNLLGLSRRTLFLCRADDSLVTKKTLMRLEAAERAAGLDHVRSDVVTEKLVRADELPENQLTRELIAQIQKLTSVVEAQGEKLLRVEELLEQRAASARQAEATSSSSRGSSSHEKTKTTTTTRKKLA